LLTGRCTCGDIRYELTDTPLFVHACHCTWCQRETGSAFVLNALIETSKVILLSGTPLVVNTPSNSGKGQLIHRCPTCHVALWSVYAGAGDRFRFLRAGTLDDKNACPPDIHIFTSSKLDWVILPPGVPAVPEYYDRAAYWPAESLARREAIYSLKAN
jgi:hypothetical protein